MRKIMIFYWFFNLKCRDMACVDIKNLYPTCHTMACRVHDPCHFCPFVVVDSISMACHFFSFCSFDSMACQVHDPCHFVVPPQLNEHELNLHCILFGCPSVVVKRSAYCFVCFVLFFKNKNPDEKHVFVFTYPNRHESKTDKSWYSYSA